MSASEVRVCNDVRCSREMSITIATDDATLYDVDRSFETLGWDGYFCPAHAYLGARSRR